MQTIGQNIANYRKEKNITQEQLAEICSVSPQAVSKWENDISCPDISLLKILARTFGISVDELLDDGTGPIIRLAEKEEPKGKLLKIRIEDKTDKASLNLPIALIELLLQNGGLTEFISVNGKKELFSSIDFRKIIELVSLGVIGKIFELSSENGDFIEIWVE